MEAIQSQEVIDLHYTLIRVDIVAQETISTQSVGIGSSAVVFSIIGGVIGYHLDPSLFGAAIGFLCGFTIFAIGVNLISPRMYAS